MDAQNKMIHLIEKLGQRHGNYNVFFHFVELAALSLANLNETVETVYSEREAQYKEIIKRYSREEIGVFPELLAILTVSLREYPDDILGGIFHAMRLENHWKGQFFTPMNICTMMAEMIIGNAKAELEKTGRITIYEPACGSGAMLIGAVRSLLRQEIEYQTQVYMEATDVDIRCVYMAYVQLGILGIAARVIHGNTITMETFSVWKTPKLMLAGNAGTKLPPSEK
jgi:hypothetical protein